jgi:hypothetical protein
MTGYLAIIKLEPDVGLGLLYVDDDVPADNQLLCPDSFSIASRASPGDRFFSVCRYAMAMSLSIRPASLPVVVLARSAFSHLINVLIRV